MAALCLVLTSQPAWALGEGTFKRIASGGIADPANSYGWGLAEFKGDIYVGTNRHHLWSLLQGMVALFPPEILVPVMPTGPDNEQWGHIDWAESFRAEIWRYRPGHGWTMVHRAPLVYGELPIASNPTLPPPPDPPIVGWYPESYGYRVLGVFEGYLYAIGIGPWVPNMPLARILRSQDGQSWEDVSGPIATATNPRGLVEYKGKLFISASLPGTAPAGAGIGLVYCYDPATCLPGLVKWKQVSLPGFGNDDNVEIPYLAVFKDCLYASTVNFQTGFEVWKTTGREVLGGKYEWTPVIRQGFGDTHNQWGMTMQPFQDHLYIGTAVGGGMVLKDNQPVGTRAIDIIRVDESDRAELMVGAYISHDPPPGWPLFRVPRSGIPAGFGNPLNVYTWHMATYKKWLLVATFDMTGILCRVVRYALCENPAVLCELLRALQANSTLPLPLPLEILSQIDPKNKAHIKAISNLFDMLEERFGGADLWKTKDGIHWEPVTLSGFKNPNNYGIRRLLPVIEDGKKVRLYVSTANPFTDAPGGGCEVLSTKATGREKDREKADFNEDGFVDFQDFALFSSQWLQ
jgi:hypothetical protein